MQTQDKNTNTDGDQKSQGTRIVALEGGRKKAIVPRNSYRWLKAVTSQKPIEWEGEAAANGMQAGAVYEVGLNIPAKAFPNMDSAKTLAQSVKASLASDKTKGGNPTEPIIEILRSGNPVSRTIVRLNVDEFEQAAGNQGVKSLGAGRKTTKGGRGGRKTTAAKGGRRKGGRGTGSGRTTPTPQPQAEVVARRQGAGSRRQTSIESFLNGLQLKNWSEFKAAEAEVQTLEQKCPIIYNHLVKGIAA